MGIKAQFLLGCRSLKCFRISKEVATKCLMDWNWVTTLNILLFAADAAVLMLKTKIHRIPIVNDEGQVVGK